MAMQTSPFLRKLSRLFTIRTRLEAWAVTWAISLGAVERGKTYLATYPGALGWLFFLLCVGVVFLAGAKLLDSVAPAAKPMPARRLPPSRHLGRGRPKSARRMFGSAAPRSFRRD